MNIDRIVRPGLLTGGLLAVLLAAVLVGRHAGDGRKALTKYKAELRAQGEKLTFQELAAPSTEETNNFHTLLTNAVARLKVGVVQPSLLEPRRFTSPGHARVLFQESALSSWRGVAKTNQSGWENLAAAMKQNEAVLADLRSCLKHPAAQMGPKTNLLSGPIPNFFALRTAAQWFMGASIDQLHQGNAQMALENLEALIALARCFEQEPSIVAQMIRVAIAGLGTAVTWEALQAPDWSEPQLERLQIAWSRVDLFEGLETAFLAERAIGEEVWTVVRRNNNAKIRQTLHLSTSKTALGDAVDDYLLIPAYKLSSIDEDELLRLRSMQTTLTAIRGLRKDQPWKEANQGLQKNVARINSIAATWERFRYPFTLISIPNMQRAMERGVCVESERRMTVVALALKRFQLKTGMLPGSLAELAPDYLHAVPLDPMSGKAFAYRLKQDGTFVLYSVGKDGIDDGGDGTPVKGSGLDFWSGRDAVWPSPASIANRATQLSLSQIVH
jgi:hypothetical protein